MDSVKKPFTSAAISILVSRSSSEIILEAASMSSSGAAEATMWSTSMATWASVETAKAAAMGTTVGANCRGSRSDSRIGG